MNVLELRYNGTIKLECGGAEKMSYDMQLVKESRKLGGLKIEECDIRVKSYGHEIDVDASLKDRLKYLALDPFISTSIFRSRHWASSQYVLLLPSSLLSLK